MATLKILKNYFKLQIFSFKLMGIAIYTFENLFVERMYRIYSFVFLNFCIYLFIITEVIDLIVKWGDIDNMTFNICYLVTHFTGLCKTIAIMVGKGRIKGICGKLESGLFLPNYDRDGIKEYEIISEATRQSNLQTYIFYVLVIVIVANRGFYAGFDKGYLETVKDAGTNETIIKYYQIMPYTTWFPFDTNISPYYEIGFTYQIISCLFYGLLIGTCDSLITGFMVHIKAQLIILKNRIGSYIMRAEEQVQMEITNIAANKLDVNEKLKPEVQKFVTFYLKKCIIHHQEIINLVEITESDFTYLILVQFMGSLALLCFQLFQLSMNEVKAARFFSMLCYVCLMLFQLIIYCWNGNEIEKESLEVAIAIYDSSWILCDTQIQKSVMLIIQRAQRPLRISAGKFVYLTLETFMNILRASASYYMVLRRVNE